MACTADELAELVLLKADLLEVRKAITMVLTSSQVYTLDTSQTRQSVTRANIGSLRLLKNEIRSDISALESQCSGGSSFIARPAW